MICDRAGAGRKSSVRIKNQEETAGIRCDVGLISLCVDAGGRTGEQGELHHLYEGKTVAFCSLFEAVNQMEELYDAISYPRAASRLRSFWTDQKPNSHATGETPIFRPGEIREAGALEQVLRCRGAKATFWIRVLYRQHTSWQGEVTWVERQKKEHFRSTLELLRLLYGALHGEIEKGGSSAAMEI